MKLVIQRVNHASVTINGDRKASIGKGLLVLLGISTEDTTDILPKYVNKLTKMRIFADENDKTNLSIQDVNGSLLIVSQFTLYADCRKGNRPSFTDAGSPVVAKSLYEKFVSLCREIIPDVQTGEFGADMKVNLENDGPFTVILDSNEDAASLKLC